MSPHTYRDRRAVSVENADVRVTVLEEGGHIAEILDKRSGINPLWTPPWRSIEPSTYDPTRHREYGDGPDARLLAGIMGHNLCLDIFGGPSAEEAAGGMDPHGDASVARYEIDTGGSGLSMQSWLPLAQIRVAREIELHDRAVRIRESIESLTAFDRPIGWTEHVTLGPPFLEKGLTEFRVSATRSKVFEAQFGASDYLERGAEFDWPYAPRCDGAIADLRVYTDQPASSAYTAHLMDPSRPDAFFVAFSPSAQLAFGYVWPQREFPWMGIWEENGSRSYAPWNGKALTRGMEFGVSPMPESRRQMVERGTLFGVPTYRWLPAGSRVRVEYWALVRSTDRIPEVLSAAGG